MKKSIFFIMILKVSIFLFCSETILKELEFGRIFIEDKNECIFTNYGSHKIRKYSQNGKLLLEMGRKGRGPGDINRIAWFDINPKDDNIYVTELQDGNRWISIFSKEGKYLREWDIELDRQKPIGLSFIKFDDRGNAYLMTTKTHWSKYKDFQLGKVERVISKFLPDGKKSKVIYRLKSIFCADKYKKGNITIPFHNYIYFDVWKDNIAIRESCNDFIGIYNLEGELIKKISLPFKREKLKKEDIDNWEKWMKSYPDIRQDIARGIFDLRYWKKSLPFPEYKPVSGGKIFFDQLGNIFTKKYIGYSGDRIDLWMKIDIQTGKSTYKKMAKNEYLLYVTGKYIYFLRVMDDDNRLVVKVNRKEFNF